jgi:hypothetical protein
MKMDWFLPGIKDTSKNKIKPIVAPQIHQTWKLLVMTTVQPHPMQVPDDLVTTRLS